MKVLKFTALFLFVFFIGLFGFTGFEIKKISLIQIGYNFIQTLIFFVVLICLDQFEKMIDKKKYTTVKAILFRFIFVIGICVVIAFANQELILFFDSSVAFWPYHINLMTPIIYLIYDLFKILDKGIEKHGDD